MRAPSGSFAITLLCLSGLGLACEAKPGPATAEPSVAAEPTPDDPPVADEPVGEEPPKEEPPASKCFTEGGTCVFEKATLECKRFEEGPDWGCTDEHTGCCFQK